MGSVYACVLCVYMYMQLHMTIGTSSPVSKLGRNGNFIGLEVCGKPLVKWKRFNLLILTLSGLVFDFSQHSRCYLLFWASFESNSFWTLSNEFIFILYANNSILWNLRSKCYLSVCHLSPTNGLYYFVLWGFQILYYHVRPLFSLLQVSSPQ